MRGVKFCRRNVGVRRDAAKGLWIGRQTDRLLNEHILGRKECDPSNSRHRRLGHILRALRSSGVVLVRPQFPTIADGVQLKTNVDAVGVRGDEVVVIELKTTQHDRRDHQRKLYDTPCSNQPVLANGLANTERVHHGLQAGFGVWCVRSVLGPGTKVRGAVVVSYEDGAVVEFINPMYASPAWFSSANALNTTPLATSKPAVGKPKQSRRGGGWHKPAVPASDMCMPWPHDDPRVCELARRGRFSVASGQACHAVGVVLPGSVRAVGICLKRPLATHTARDRGKIYQHVLKTGRGIFGTVTLRTLKQLPVVVLAPGNKRTWSLAPLDKKRAPRV